MFRSSHLGVKLELVLGLGLKIGSGLRLGLGFVVAFNCN